MRNFFIGLATGLVTGGVISILYTPRSGREIREFVKDKIETVKSKLPLAKLDKVH